MDTTTTPPPVAFDMCAEATNFGRAEAKEFRPNLLARRAKLPDPFLDRIEKENFPENVGYTNAYRTYEPTVSMPIEHVPEAVPLERLPLHEIPLLGVVDRQFTISAKGFRTPLFCIFDLPTKEVAREMLAAYKATVGANMDYFVSRQVQSAFTRICRNKIVMTSRGFTKFRKDAEEFAPVAAESELTPQFLDGAKTYLDFTVSSAPNMQRDERAQMVYDLLVDEETSMAVAAASVGAKDRTKFAREMGSYNGKTVDGFRHLYQKWPARWNLKRRSLLSRLWSWVRRKGWPEKLKWVQARPFDPPTPNKPNTPQEVSREYQDAEFTDTVVFTTAVLRVVSGDLVPRVGPGPYGTPVTDFVGGEWCWFNSPGIQGCNLEGTSGFWWMIARFGFKEVDPQAGMVIRHRRPNR